MALKRNADSEALLSALISGGIIGGTVSLIEGNFEKSKFILCLRVSHVVVPSDERRRVGPAVHGPGRIGQLFWAGHGVWPGAQRGAGGGRRRRRFQEKEEVVERLAGARARPRLRFGRPAIDRTRRLSMRLEEEAAFDVDARRRRRERDGQDGRGHVLIHLPMFPPTSSSE